MCIALDIKRPQAAIADASRLIIKDVYPTYMTANSFLESAQFSIVNSSQDEDAHGGFGDKGGEDAQLAIGLGRENITGVLPLYLFKEHWLIAKR